MLVKADLIPCLCTEKGKRELKSLLTMPTVVRLQKMLPCFHLGNSGLEYMNAFTTQMANTYSQKHFGCIELDAKIDSCKYVQ